MNYKKKIIEMVEKIENKEFLIKIYYFVKVHFDKDKKLDVMLEEIQQDLED